MSFSTASPRDGPAEPSAGPSSIGPYSLERELGSGGQATVFEATDTRLGRRVALKVVERASASGLALDRFRREAEVASRLDHPGICQVYDAGVREGIPYIAMRFVEGRTLAAGIRTARATRTQEPSVATFIALVGDAEPPAESPPIAMPRGAICWSSTKRYAATASSTAAG